jgi:uncharacterized protein (DUF488 family)
MTPLRIFTVGHSTQPAGRFLSLLEARGVTGVADVRARPQSRRHPHFSQQPLARFLSSHAIAYQHFPGLGGMRTPRPDSPHTGWREPAFRAYADHMGSAEFQAALSELLEFAKKVVAVVMCAESQWWQCHRQLIADALVARGIDVRHIMSASPAPAHDLTSFARVTGTDVDYPGLL